MSSFDTSEFNSVIFLVGKDNIEYEGYLRILQHNSAFIKEFRDIDKYIKLLHNQNVDYKHFDLVWLWINGIEEPGYIPDVNPLIIKEYFDYFSISLNSLIWAKFILSYKNNIQLQEFVPDARKTLLNDRLKYLNESYESGNNIEMKYTKEFIYKEVISKNLKDKYPEVAQNLVEEIVVEIKRVLNEYESWKKYNKNGYEYDLFYVIKGQIVQTFGEIFSLEYIIYNDYSEDIDNLSNDVTVKLFKKLKLDGVINEDDYNDAKQYFGEYCNVNSEDEEE